MAKHISNPLSRIWIASTLNEGAIYTDYLTSSGWEKGEPRGGTSIDLVRKLASYENVEYAQHPVLTTLLFKLPLKSSWLNILPPALDPNKDNVNFAKKWKVGIFNLR